MLAIVTGHNIHKTIKSIPFALSKQWNQHELIKQGYFFCFFCKPLLIKSASETIIIVHFRSQILQGGKN